LSMPRRHEHLPAGSGRGQLEAFQASQPSPSDDCYFPGIFNIGLDLRPGSSQGIGGGSIVKVM
jgi:hypothetical protein